MTDHLLDKQRIAAINARVDAATKGPWTPMIEGRDHTSGSSCIVTSAGGIDLDGASDADIEFLAHARQDIPYLVAELYRLEAMLKAI